MIAGDATGWSHDVADGFLSAMAQAATMTMGPPLSPREIRRSGRRSAPSANSKSPDSDLPRHKDNPPRPPQSAPSRTKRTHDQEDHLDDRKHLASATHSSASNSSSTAPKAKRKSRDKRRSSADTALDTLHEPQDTTTTEPADEEEQGITRCVCGSNGLFFFALIAPLTHPPPLQARTRQMLVNSWFNAKPARSGNTASVWVTIQRIRSTTPTTIANCVALSSTASSSSALLYPPSFQVFSLIPIQAIGKESAAYVYRRPCYRCLTRIPLSLSYPSPEAAFQETKHHEQSRCKF